jgi:hypothetical protein
MSYSISISVDPGAVIKAITSRKMRIAIAREVAPILARRWRVTAEDNLSKNSAQAYVNAIEVKEVSGVRVVLELAGRRANMIEHGVKEPIDMRDWLLAPYGLTSRVIPFQHATPGTAGRRGAPMGAAYAKTLGKKEAEKLGRRVYSSARKLKEGERLEAGLAPKLKAQHKTDIYAGMQRTQKEPRSATEYTTYRTISLNSPADSWMYPTRPGEHIIDKMLEEAQEDVRDAVSDVLGGVLVEVKLTKHRQGGSKP